MNDPTNWNVKTGFPLSGIVVACHSGGESLYREWHGEYGWLNPNEMVLKSDVDGKHYRVTVREIQVTPDAASKTSEGK